MNDKEALELLNIYTKATQIAKQNNKFEYKLEIQENVFIEFFQKAFPSLKNNTTLAKNILKN